MRLMKIHPSAIVDPRAELDEDVEIGPYCIIGPDVKIGRGTRLLSNVRIDGPAVIGEGNTIFHGAAIGGLPQDLGFKGERSGVRIGNGNLIREYATIHRGTGEGTETVVGDGNFLMAYSHLGHNVRVGNNCIIVNTAQIGGYGVVEDYAYISAFVPVHQFTRIGKMAMVAGSTRVNQDIPPFMMAMGYEARIIGVNRVGLMRRGFSSDRIDVIKEAYRILYREGLSLPSALERLTTEFPDNEDIAYLVNFIKNSKRGITRRSLAGDEE